MCENLRSIELPSALVSIEEEVFMGCESLESVVIPSGVTLISPRTFQGCKGLKSISIPAGVTIIAERLFKDCHSLSSITIPQGVTTIGQNAFENAYSLASVSIPSSVTGIYYNAFLSCQGLNRVDIPTLSDWFKIGFSNEYSNPLYYAHDLYVDGKYLDKLIIPDDVSAVKNYSFAGCGFSKIVIREGVTKIGDYSFAHSPKVSEVVISSGVTSIEKGVFSGCSRLERVSLPSTLISIGAEAFDSCTSLEGVDFPSSLTTIGEKAFNNCSAITSLYIPSNVTALINAFYCTGVKKLEIASSAAIAYSKDYSIGCPNVEEIFFMDELHCAIPPIFSSFEYLREVTISAGVTCVGQAAFLYNSRLNRVVILGKDLEGRSEMFYPSNDQLKIFVPADCVEKYKNADYWHDYADKIFPIE